MQHVVICRHKRVAKRTQFVAPNNVAICCVEMLRSFGWGLSSNEIESRGNKRMYLKIQSSAGTNSCTEGKLLAESSHCIYTSYYSSNQRL